MKRGNIGYLFSAIPLIGMWFIVDTRLALISTLFATSGFICGYFWEK